MRPKRLNEELKGMQLTVGHKGLRPAGSAGHPCYLYDRRSL